MWKAINSRLTTNHLLADYGFHTTFRPALLLYEFQTLEDYQDYIKILNDFPRYSGEMTDLLQKGLDNGISQPQVIFNGYEITFDSHVVEDPEQSVFFEPFTRIPNSISDADKEALIETGKKAIMELSSQWLQHIFRFHENQLHGEYQGISGGFRDARWRGLL